MFLKQQWDSLKSREREQPGCNSVVFLLAPVSLAYFTLALDLSREDRTFPRTIPTQKMRLFCSLENNLFSFSTLMGDEMGWEGPLKFSHRRKRNDSIGHCYVTKSFFEITLQNASASEKEQEMESPDISEDLSGKSDDEGSDDTEEPDILADEKQEAGIKSCDKLSHERGVDELKSKHSPPVPPEYNVEEMATITMGGSSAQNHAVQGIFSGSQTTERKRTGPLITEIVMEGGTVQLNTRAAKNDFFLFNPSCPGSKHSLAKTNKYKPENYVQCTLQRLLRSVFCLSTPHNKGKLWVSKK